MGVEKERKLQIRTEIRRNITKKPVDFEWEFFDVEKSLEILNYMEIISVRQENRSTDFLKEKWLNFWKKYNIISIIVGKDCCCTVPKRNWHLLGLSSLSLRLSWHQGCTVPKRNWHLCVRQNSSDSSRSLVVPYLRGIDTFCTNTVISSLIYSFVVPYLRGIDTLRLNC